jgi:hypothetical protein
MEGFSDDLNEQVMLELFRRPESLATRDPCRIDHGTYRT